MKYFVFLYSACILAVGIHCYGASSPTDQWLGFLSVKGASLAFIIYSIFIFFKLCED